MRQYRLAYLDEHDNPKTFAREVDAEEWEYAGTGVLVEVNGATRRRNYLRRPRPTRSNPAPGEPGHLLEGPRRDHQRRPVARNRRVDRRTRKRFAAWIAQWTGHEWISRTYEGRARNGSTNERVRIIQRIE